jgi:hypothetical protein
VTKIGPEEVDMAIHTAVVVEVEEEAAEEVDMVDLGCHIMEVIEDITIRKIHIQTRIICILLQGIWQGMEYIQDHQEVVHTDIAYLLHRHLYQSVEVAMQDKGMDTVEVLGVVTRLLQIHIKEVLEAKEEVTAVGV